MTTDELRSAVERGEPAAIDLAIASAEEAEKLRELLREAQGHLYHNELSGLTATVGFERQTEIRAAILAKIDAALTPPEPLSAHQETP